MGIYADPTTFEPYNVFRIGSGRFVVIARMVIPITGSSNIPALATVRSSRAQDSKLRRPIPAEVSGKCGDTSKS